MFFDQQKITANFVTVKAKETIHTWAQASAQLFYVMKGYGETKTKVCNISIHLAKRLYVDFLFLFEFGSFSWNDGDVITLPSDTECHHTGTTDSMLFWVTDQPLLSYLGVKPTMET